MRQQVDTAALKKKDIAAIVQRDLGPALQSRNGHLFWRCPFHPEVLGKPDRDPSLDVNIRKNQVFCNPCGITLDPVGWVMRYRRVSFLEAARELGALTDLPAVAVAAQPKQDKPYEPPARDWQARAAHLARHCMGRLWHDDPDAARVRAYLNRRGLNDFTLKRWRIGYNFQGRYLFGLWAHPGIMIPAYMDRQLWCIKVRLLPGHPIRCSACNTQMSGAGKCPNPICGKRQKYRSVPGSEPALFGADTCRNRRVAFGCEGEFDAMLVWQQARDLGGVFTSTNGAGKDWRPDWSMYVLDCERIITLYDNDEAGAKGTAKLTGLGDRVSTATVPAGKDVTEYHVNHRGNVFQWLNLERRTALAAGWASEEAEAEFLREQIARCDVPNELYADYCADLAELEE